MTAQSSCIALYGQRRWWRRAGEEHVPRSSVAIVSRRSRSPSLVFPRIFLVVTARTPSLTSIRARYARAPRPFGSSDLTSISLCPGSLAGLEAPSSGIKRLRVRAPRGAFARLPYGRARLPRRCDLQQVARVSLAAPPFCLLFRPSLAHLISRALLACGPFLQLLSARRVGPCQSSNLQVRQPDPPARRS